MEPEKKKMFLQFLNYVHDFINKLECGDSYFEYNGEKYSADMGYGLDFWFQIYDILKKEFLE